MLRNKYQVKRRQKAADQPVFRIENETNPEDAAQYFQVTVNIHEARKLAWTNPHSPNSYVIVVVGKKKQRTNVKRDMEVPFYKEYFIFEMCMSVSNLKRTNVWLAIMEPRCCAPPRLLGETNVDLGTVWTQPHHQVINKWAQLSLSRDPAAGIVGFLKVDISIIYKGYMDIIYPIGNDDEVEENLLLPSGSEQQRANYLITIYGGFGLNNPTLAANDRNYGKAPSTFVTVTFCGLTTRTAVQRRNHNPTFCEQVSIVEMFPNMSQVIYLELFSGDFYLNKVIGSISIKLTQISHDGDNGFIPTFGPSLLHMYGTSNNTLCIDGDNGAFHRGALLVSLKTIVPYYQQSIRTTNVEPVAPINWETLWALEDFCIFCPILEVSMLDRRVVGKNCGVAITIPEMPNEHVGDEKFLSMMSDIRSRKLHYTGPMDVIKSQAVYGYLDFANTFPVLQLATRLPDFRFRMYRNNMIYTIFADLEYTLKDVERRFKNLDYSTPNELIEELNNAIDVTAGKILKFLDVMQTSSKTGTNCDDAIKKYDTDLDQKQLALQKEEIEKIYKHISKMDKQKLSNNVIESTATNKSNIATRKEVKLLLAKTKAVVQNLKPLVFKAFEGWPDIVVWLLNSGSRVAYAKVSASDVIYSEISEQRGRYCGRIQTMNMKPLKCTKQMHSPNTGCYCIVGKIELSFWMGSYKQLSAFKTLLPDGYRIKVKDCLMSLKAAPMMLECRAFIYRAKLANGIDDTNQAYTFVRVNALNNVKDSRASLKTLTPVWNQVLKINQIVHTSQDKLMHSPPNVCIELCESNLSSKTELIGRTEVQPVVDDRQDYEFAPKLQWYELHKGVEHTGQLLMSVQILQIPETLLRTTNYGPVDEIYYVAETQEHKIDNIETLPDTLVPQFTTYKLDIYWWGLRDVNITRNPGVLLEIEELAVKSDIIIDKRPNCNFPNGRTTHTFDAPLDEAYSHPLTIRLYEQSTFGRTLFLGTNVVKNPNKYIIYWYSKNERELALKNAMIGSANFNEGLPLQNVNNNTEYNVKKRENMNQLSHTNLIQAKKRSRWRKLFSRREPNEEEYILLPMYIKDKDNIKKTTKVIQKNEDSDWWIRYFSSQKDTDDNNLADDRITIYNTELEGQPEFSKFKDWCTTFKLYNGKKTGIPEKDEKLHCGYLKAGIAIYKWPPPQHIIAVSRNGVDMRKGYFKDRPSNEPVKFLVRAYIIKGVNLTPKYFTGKLDAYSAISCGNTHMGDRNCYISNTVNPVFAKMYEFRCSLPEDYLLTISVCDHDAMCADELIGSTTIDLEDRIYTKHRARVGLPFIYNSEGPARWRDCLRPSAILEDLCKSNNLPAPTYTNMDSVIINNVEYQDNGIYTKTSKSPSDKKENLCLSLLHKWHTLPICGHHLVPEHVETRSLYNPEKEGIEQGKIQMWVDIFPLDNNRLYVPNPIDITPRKVEDYELRIVIWDVRVLWSSDDASRGNKHGNIYVKAWIGIEEEAQYTDVHRHTKSGEGSFNWRMIFHFQYQHTAGKLVKKEKGPFIEYEELTPPIVTIQVLEKSSVSQDDFIASSSLNLSSLSEGTDYATKCGNTKKINLFSMKSIRAWWPLFAPDEKNGLNINVGMIDMEMTLLPSKTAVLFPVGLGRDPPQPLPEPHRSEFKGSNHFQLLETLFRYGGLEYAVVGVILIISFTLVCLYFEIPRLVFDYMFD